MRAPRQAARQVVAAGLLVGLGAVLHVLEGIVPIPVTVPGAKLGLANAATLLGLAVGGPAVAMAVAVVRPVLGGFVGGGFGSAGFVLSVAGSLAGALAMCGLWRLGRSDGAARGRLSLTGVSLAGGVAHNLGQLTVATRYVGTAAALAYLGPLMLAGLVAGYLVGRLATAIAASPLVRGGYPGVS